MTDTQILDMLDKYFQSPNNSGWDFSNGDKILEFARAMYEEGYDQGCYEATGGQ